MDIDHRASFHPCSPRSHEAWEQCEAETWEFSVDDDSDKNPLLKQLHEAEKSEERIALDYRQDLHSLFRCTPSEYFVTKIE